MAGTAVVVAAAAAGVVVVVVVVVVDVDAVVEVADEAPVVRSI